MRRGSGLLLFAFLVLGCTRDADVVSSGSPAFDRTPPLREVLRSNGDGSVGEVSRLAITQLEKGDYQCSELGGPILHGSTVKSSTYRIGSGADAMVVKLISKNGTMVQRTIHYTDGSGNRRIVIENSERPLGGADTIATEIFAAAAAAPCPAPTD